MSFTTPYQSNAKLFPFHSIPSIHKLYHLYVLTSGYYGSKMGMIDGCFDWDGSRGLTSILERHNED